MPHFSPISWFVAGLIFYLVLFTFMSIIWWLQNFCFSMDQNFNMPELFSWGW